MTRGREFGAAFHQCLELGLLVFGQGIRMAGEPAGDRPGTRSGGRSGEVLPQVKPVSDLGRVRRPGAGAG